MPNSSPRGKRYMPGLDGLRALSVIAVIAYHLNFPWASGGLLGVGIFFVLSGYLITDQLIAQWKRHRKLDLRDFLIRRARRLLPAMFVMLAFVAVWLLLTDRSRLAGLQGDFASVALYFNNWWLIFHDVSYFESFGPPSPIGHLWSLSIEEQFYLIWPLLLVLGLRIAPRRGKLILLILAGAALSAAAMAVIFEPGTDPSRVYYGTDTRVFALLIGAALAVAWPSERLSSQLAPGKRNLLDAAGGIGLAILVVMMGRTDEYGDFLYVGGLALLSAITAIVIAVLAHPASRLARIMGCKPLRWIGKHSYSLYIWHYPVIALTSPAIDTGGIDGLRVALQIGASFLLAALSWKYVEEPIRRGAWKEWLRRFRPQYRLRYGSLLVGVISPLMLLNVSCGGGIGASAAHQPPAETAVHETASPPPASVNAKPPKSDSVKQEEPPKQENVPSKQEPAPSESSKEPSSPSKSPDEAPTGSEPGAQREGEGVTVIGDSVILDAAPYLEKLLPGIEVDGKIGRQMVQAQEVVNQRIKDGTLGNLVVIELGTNGPFNSKQLRKLLDTLGEDRRIVLVNTRVPEKWQDTVNSALSKVAGDYANVSLLDWYSASKNKNSFFYKDGVHLKPEGSKFYAALIADSVKQEAPRKSA